jgi:hypothetical protein
VLLPVPPEKLSIALPGLAALGFRGCNVTTPHKQAVMPMLDRVDELARRIDAVNTIVVEKDGTLTGFNNDGNGFVQSLRDAKADWRPDAGPIVVLGAGGAARAVVASLAARARARSGWSTVHSSGRRGLPRNLGRRSLRFPGNNATMLWRTWPCSRTRPIKVWRANLRSTLLSIACPARIGR